ncbi:uncharacterized protein L3040_009539 [Drepanopeziza brunnea f. sp. 'multigermtubi']|uniref:Myb-like domain-containing protein n=1 Tax=Marssonina brunnea f. sp. multigermtubi (strain MB_m1) TaxID=1072389 RepID=K1WT43_MARBU|nr:uncharacterized protein MBM_05515 [Drepanopeziza brunnea f. sp. 'multigermtubi' MB_m1]EKD16221.1 hypothetical protein MBM_05515 [Drepanopeziza brunnea f. sp. 'multigermtubi' MB_m1]KAJ5032953.1 hypothetical protein L3040_009539 [Drepanopeziza brunnea f. sp. 'multigermtubi']
MPSVWDHKADKDLLLTIIDEGSLKSIAWPSISNKMADKGYSFTHEGCRQHFQKIRKEARNGHNALETLAPSPSKAKAKAKAVTTPRKASKKENAPWADGDDNKDDYEDLPPPSSKRKREVKKEQPLDQESSQAYQFKVEYMGDVKPQINFENDEIYD